MGTIKWAAGSGVGLTWTSCFQAADLNSCANASSVLSSTGDVANGTALDLYADVCFLLGSITSAAPNKLDLFIYPFNQDGSTYGDNQLTAGTQAAVTPSSSLWCGTLILPVGTLALKGIITGIEIPPGTFRFAVQNNTGATLAASANAIYYRTYNLSD